MPDRISFVARVFKTLSNIRLKSCRRRQRRRRLTVRTTSKSFAAALVVRFDGQGPPMPFMSRHQLTGAKTSHTLSPSLTSLSFFLPFCMRQLRTHTLGVVVLKPPLCACSCVEREKKPLSLSTCTRTSGLPAWACWLKLLSATLGNRY